MAERPNIVLIISDQQRQDSIATYGRNEAYTPALDSLAAEGITFNNAFCTSPMCSPARASILSGLFPHTHRLVSNHQQRPGCDRIHLPEDVKLLADYLPPHDYVTGYFGKWHLGTGSDRRGFRDMVARLTDYDVDGPQDNDFLQYARKLGIELKGKQGGYDPDPALYDSRLKTGPSIFSCADHPASFMCDRAVEFIQRYAGGDKPFCFVYSCHEPHPAFVVPEPFFSLHKPEDIVLPDNFKDPSGDSWARRGGWQLKLTSEFSEEDLRRMWAAYLGAVSFVDHLTGRIMAALRQCDVWNDTIVIFTSDHGEMLGSHDLLFKGSSLCEELLKVPFIIKAPQIKESGRFCDSLISQVDIVPTLLDLCGIETQSAFEGQSFAHNLSGGDGRDRLGVPAEFHSSNWTDPIVPLRMWRTQDWKYIEAAAGDNELYDLQADPGECNNLYNNPEYGEQVKIMREALHKWLAESGDKFPDVIMPEK